MKTHADLPAWPVQTPHGWTVAYWTQSWLRIDDRRPRINRYGRFETKGEAAAYIRRAFGINRAIGA